MKSILFKLPIIIVLLSLSLITHASGDHDEHDGDHEEQQMVTIDDHIAEKSMIETAIASSGIINEQLKVYGKTVNDPSQVSHIRARFPGTVVNVNVQIGDTVKVGDTLAFVESNESLKKYPIKALMPGVVVARHANPGEMALDQVLFTVANFEKIWVELQVFPGQLNQINSDQQVLISGSDKTVTSKIEHIIPSQDERPYSVARVLISNQSRDWTTGLLVSGQVSINTTEADLVVPSKAIQIIENESVVFVKTGNTYTALVVETGRTDGKFTEILSGLHLGDVYVSENSYLIKADLEKSGASHDH
ncbi:efflux RND transporter periplasmic adaptor subunit [Marinicella sp. S1101]|uniref:efflux RND transporter periplasmic adaptor subunit n=1 Tax=Marinicella marina TaxID=2996016 RepID=UPI002260C661|nr:efflux RND transporter periplasmic adaptor subunit [Marinicella marina]MCX7554209.1 efflux RND transporter periplasmic adaptor subunit [Marinicella marina]MDJ1141098.1 efflux RND transporter periplasmic adaptor subunit [Marinicella marina]